MSYFLLFIATQDHRNSYLIVINRKHGLDLGFMETLDFGNC